MRVIRALVLLAAVSVALGGCADQPGRRSAGGTVSMPAEQLSPGIEVVAQPPTDLPTPTTQARIQHNEVCGSLPRAALTELGYGQPHDAWYTFCQWLDTTDGHHFVNVGYLDGVSIAEVGLHPELLAHLRWLRIDGRYAAEQINDGDPMQACSVIVDYGAPETLVVITYTGKDTATTEAIDRLCPKSRKVAQIVLKHISTEPGQTTTTGSKFGMRFARLSRRGAVTVGGSVPRQVQFGDVAVRDVGP